MTRPRKVVVALGGPSMGKTSLARRIVMTYQQAHGDESVRVLDPSGAFPELGEWPLRSPRGRCEECDTRHSRTGGWIAELTAHGDGPAGGGWGPGLLVLDDADRYLTPSSLDDWRDLWLANRHLGLDVVVTAHRPQGIPKELLGAASELWLFGQDEPLALDYLRTIRPVARALEAGHLSDLPASPGEAVRVLPREGRAELVRLF